MQLIDREEERRNAQQSPRERRKKLISTILVSVLMVVYFGYVYISNHHPAFIGVPHPVVVAGFEIIPGETTGAQLYDAGFQIAPNDVHAWDLNKDGTRKGYTEFLPLDTKAEKHTSYYSLELIKDHRSYGSLLMVNESASDKTLADTKVQEITVLRVSEGMEHATLEGIAAPQLTKEALVAIAGEPTKEEISPDNKYLYTTLEWNKGFYTMTLCLDPENKLYSFSSSYERN